MSNRDDALQDILRLSRNHGITLAEITAALKAENTPEQSLQSSGSILTKLLGYIGGIFIFSGLCVFIGMFWNDFGSAARVIITLGSGLTAFFMAVAAAGDAKYARAATPLFLIAAALEPFGIFVMLDEYSNGGDPKNGVLFMAFFMLVQQGCVLLAKQRTTLAFTTLFFGCVFFGQLMEIMDMPDNLIGLTLGSAILFLCRALDKSPHSAITPFWYFCGSMALMISFYDIVENKPAEILFLGLSALLVYVSTQVRSRTLLTVGTLGMIGYIGYFSGKHFSNVVGWPIALIIIGLVFIGMSALAMRLNRKYIRQG